MANKFQSSAFTNQAINPKSTAFGGYQDPMSYAALSTNNSLYNGQAPMDLTKVNNLYSGNSIQSAMPQASQMAGLGTTGQIAAQSTNPSTQGQGFFNSIGDMFNDTFRKSSFGDLGSMGQKGLSQYGATPEQFNDMNFEGQQALLGHTTEGFTPAEQLDFAKADNLQSLADQRNSFDWGGVANLGLSAFNAYNQYNYQNEALKMAKNEAAVRDRELARKDKTRSNWSGVL